jgi:hypothetical protein
MYTADRSKFISASLSAMSCMVMMGLPHINVMSKMDLVKGNISKRNLEDFLDPDTMLLDSDPMEMERRRHEQEGEDEAGEGGVVGAEQTPTSPAFSSGVMTGSISRKLNHAVANLVEEMGLVKYLKLHVSDEESVEAILSQIDYIIQYQEAQEPREPKDEAEVDYND